MIAILDYDAGNLTSVKLAVEHVGAECRVTRDPEEVYRAEKVIFPGVGAAASCMEHLRFSGMDKAIAAACAGGKPLLAICVGMQLLFAESEEDGGVGCLGILPGRVWRFAFPPEPRVKVPHMGWNAVDFVRPHPVWDGIPAGSEFYFVHSYYVEAAEDADVLGRSEYAGAVFTSAAARGNFAACQFHPEKSGEAGLRLLKNFAEWKPEVRDAQ